MVRSTSYIRAALQFQEPDRDQVLVVAGFLTGLVWMLARAADSPPATLAFAPFLLATLLAICAIDARYGIIPNALVLQLGALGVLFVMVGQASDAWLGHALAVGSVLGGGHLLHAMYRSLRGYDGFGLGDVKLVAAAALWIRWEALPFMIIVAVVSATASLAIIRFQRRLARTDAVPFGPHLALGLWALYLVDPIGLLARFSD